MYKRQAVLSDFQIDAIKIGMVYNSSIIKVIHSTIKNQRCPIIVDPIIESTTKTILLKKSAIKDYKKMIIPLATVITPNKKESKILSGSNKVKVAAERLQKMGAKNVIVTGFRESNSEIDVFVMESNSNYILKGKKIKMANHGSGCNYSASITASLAKKISIYEATRIAKKYVYESIKNSKDLGKGIKMTLSLIHI